MIEDKEITDFFKKMLKDEEYNIITHVEDDATFTVEIYFKYIDRYTIEVDFENIIKNIHDIKNHKFVEGHVFEDKIEFIFE